MSDTESVELHNIMNDDEHLANADYFTNEEGDIESGINTGTNSEIASLITNNSEKETSMLFTGKILANWAIYDSFIIDWAEKRDLIKETRSKKILCPWHVNASCPKLKNPNSLVFINKIIDTHNHELSVDAITFEQEKNLPIYSKDLYAAISKFRPTAKSLLNDTAQMSNWLDSQKEKDPRWIVERGWDDDNVFTYLMWMTPNQVKNWIEFSDCVINDIIYKTNRYRMPLLLFVGFDHNRQNILLAQGLLADESQSSHVWFFEQILKATNIQPTVIMTDSDPAVDAVVKEVFTMIYPIYCAFHITQNLHKNLCSLIGSEYNNFLKDFISTKEYWAHSYIAFKFTRGIIATSRIEGINACLKRLLYNSNISLCELMHKIYKLLNQENKQNQYQYWKLTIPMVKNIAHANFLFMEVNKYYIAFDNKAEIVISDAKKDYIENPKATLQQLLEIIEPDNINEIWEIKIEISLVTKHYVVLLKNDSHFCSCLTIVQQDIICQHYFQVMLSNKKTKFHIQMIPSRWYQKDKNASFEPFVIADKYHNNNETYNIQQENDKLMTYLCAIDKEKIDLTEKRTNIYEQKVLYGTLHGMYKKALQKALQTKSNSRRLIEVLQEFTNMDEDEEKLSSSKDSQDDNIISDKENLTSNVFQLQNPKRKQGRGRPAGTKRLKASYEITQDKGKQQRCKKC
ncbi:23160_t:CDS:2, partial [Gigaspora margarita]